MPRIDRASIPRETRTAITSHVDTYIRSLLVPDIDVLKTCFYDHSTIFGVMNNHVAGGPIQALYDIVERDGGLPHLEWENSILALTPSTALVQVKLFQEAPRYEVTDLLSLIKLPDDRWIIVNKTFTMYQYIKPLE